MTAFTESTVEDAALSGWKPPAGVAHGPDIAPAMPAPSAPITGSRPRPAPATRSHVSTELPVEALEDAFRKLSRPEARALVQRNRALHRLLVDGVTVSTATPRARSGSPGAGDRLRRRREQRLAGGEPVHRCREQAHPPDVVLFVNGLPLAVVELKNAASEDANDWAAFQQLQTYKAECRRCSRPTPC